MIYTDFIYDFDGTLGDSYPMFTESFLILLGRYGISETYERALALLKVSVRHALKQYEFPKELDEISREYRVLREEMCREKLQPISGAEELLSHVCENGGNNYLYTHSGNYVWEILEKWGFRKYFSGGVTGSDHFPVKPAPDAVLHLLSHHGLSPETTVMVGDRDIDILAGKNGGISGILLDPDGFYPDAETDYRVNTLSEIIPILHT